jgi:hypothetical protein
MAEADGEYQMRGILETEGRPGLVRFERPRLEIIPPLRRTLTEAAQSVGQGAAEFREGGAGFLCAAVANASKGGSGRWVTAQ